MYQFQDGGEESLGKQCAHAFFGCSNSIYDTSGDRTDFSFFSVPHGKNIRRVWENRMSRTAGKDEFVIANATRVCNQQSDIVRVPGGSRLGLNIANQMESEARWRTKKRESSEKPKSTI